MKITNGVQWLDTAGNVISAHGGGFLQKDGYFYWFGENRNGKKLVSCYRSRDLVNWEFLNDVVTMDTHPELNPSNCERPKVLYNEKTGKYVMWLHWENGIHYGEARCAVLVSDTVDGDYQYLRSFRPLGHMSRDCTLYKDDDGTAYFISAANENADLHVYRLTHDYLDIAALEKILWEGQKREAPALVKRGDYYFLVTSGCTGWEPNQGKYAYATSITGEWSELKNLGSPTTYDTQPTYILTIQGTEKTTYLYVGDRWDPSDYHNSTYAFLPLEFEDDTTPKLSWASTVEIDVETGEVTTEVQESGLYRLQVNMRYLTVEEGQLKAARLSYANENQLWEVEEVVPEIIRIKHHKTGKYLQPTAGSTEDGAHVELADRADSASQEWSLYDTGGGYVKLQNRHSGLALKVQRGTEGPIFQTEMNQRRYGWWDEQAFLLAKVFK